MAQADYTILNDTRTAVRADLNAHLAAIVSNNSGATEPATMFAYQWWADTTTGLLKQRNAANSAWITIGTLASANLGHALLAANTFTGLQNWAAGADIASAATVDLTAATGNSPRITGTTATSAVTMNAGQICLVVADAAWPLTYHATTNKINGGASYTLTAGDMVLYSKDNSGVVHGFIIKADGTPVAVAGNNVVELAAGNGHGSTNTKVRRFTTTQTNTGTAITYADSATGGASLTINVAGIYAISYRDSRAADGYAHGVSLNSAQLTTNIDAITDSYRIAMNVANSSVFAASAITVSRTLRLLAGDVIRPHTNGTPDSTSAVTSFFSISKVGV